MTNISNISNKLGFNAARLMSVLNRYYKDSVSNRVVLLWENIGFLLSYLHITKIATQDEIVDIIEYLKANGGDEEGCNSIACAAEFYSRCFYEMFTTKTWTLPDKIAYNLTHPQSWDDFSIRIPIEEINMVEVIEIWDAIGRFITNVFNPEISK